MLSPHLEVQVVADVLEPPVQMYPFRVPVQSLLQPIPSSLFPSSQFSGGEISFPSPQIGVQVDFAPSTLVQV